MLLFYVAISVICCPLCACVFVLAPRLVLGAVYKYLREPLQVLVRIQLFCYFKQQHIRRRTFTIPQALLFSCQVLILSTFSLFFL